MTTKPTYTQKSNSFTMGEANREEKFMRVQLNEIKEENDGNLNNESFKRLSEISSFIDDNPQKQNSQDSFVLEENSLSRNRG